MSKSRFDLTAKEKLIFNRLLDVLRYFNLHTQVRVAGGWVRDKLLGKECHDIDIALDNMSGREFCEKVNEYLSASGEETRGMRFGTAEEDAYRRDLTINSLFYNINTNSVEDFTGRGISDLKSGKIVTPLPPKQTFLDDPLRVLRAIRFGARFGFTLDEELKAAADKDVKAAIADKISRERIGDEIDLMVSGNQPVKVMSYVADLQLFWSVFSLPAKFEPPISEGCDRLCVSYIDSSWRLLEQIGSSSFTIPVVSYISLNSLKLKLRDAETVDSLHISLQKFVSLIPLVLAKDGAATVEVDWKKETIDVPNYSKLRVLAGLLLREIKEFWRAALVLSLLLYLTDIACFKDSANTELIKRRELFKAIEDAILKLGLDKVWAVKPLVNGNNIKSILQVKGPLVGEWQQKVLEWQLAYPSGTAEECIDWMRETYSKCIDWMRETYSKCATTK